MSLALKHIMVLWCIGNMLQSQRPQRLPLIGSLCIKKSSEISLSCQFHPKYHIMKSGLTMNGGERDSPHQNDTWDGTDMTMRFTRLWKPCLSPSFPLPHSYGVVPHPKGIIYKMGEQGVGRKEKAWSYPNPIFRLPWFPTIPFGNHSSFHYSLKIGLG